MPTTRARPARPSSVCKRSASGRKPLLHPRERAALAWTEQLARLSQGPLPHGLLDELREHFDDKEIAELTLAVSAINAWNRFGVGMGMQPE